MDEISPSIRGNWENYIKGIFHVIQEEGFSLQGLDVLVSSDIPLKAGLSSSAAFEISMLSAVNKLYGLHLPPLKIAMLGQRAENNFVGMQCGIMDQFIAIFGMKNRAILLDCITLQHEYVPLKLEKKGLRILVYDTQVKRELALSDYDTRRNEAHAALDVLRKAGFKTYRDIDLSTLVEMRPKLESILFKRARHVISENDRVNRAVCALKNEDFITLGNLLFQSHESLRDDYEVSCPELDLLYEIGRRFSSCLGVRLTGAGFGGSCIAIVEEENIPVFKEMILREAVDRGFIRPVFYEIKIGGGERIHALASFEKE